MSVFDRSGWVPPANCPPAAPPAPEGEAADRQLFERHHVVSVSADAAGVTLVIGAGRVDIPRAALPTVLAVLQSHV